MTSTKAVAPYDDNYVFTLGDDLRAMAETELRETEEVRKHALVAMREWLDKNPKIVKCRYDASFLLRFLRAKKFSLPVVQETLERYILLRQNYEGGVFTQVQLEETNVMDLLNRGMMTPLPKKDVLGRRVILIQPRVLDMAKHTIRDLIRLFTIVTDYLTEDEENQIRGFVYLIDAGGASMQLATIVTPKEAIRLIRNGEALVPMRHALGIALNVPSALKMFVDLALSLMSEKLRSRARFTNDVGTCPEIEKSNLPIELGGDRLTMAQMIEAWKEEMVQMDVKTLVEQNDRMEVNRLLFTKRQMDGDFGRNDSDVILDQWGLNSVQGSFRKLEVD